MTLSKIDGTPCFQGLLRFSILRHALLSEPLVLSVSDWFEREKGEYVSRNAEMIDDCAHTCQLFPETKVRESQEGSVRCPGTES